MDIISLPTSISIDMADYRVYDDDKEDTDLVGDMNVSIITAVLSPSGHKVKATFLFLQSSMNLMRTGLLRVTIKA